MKVTVAALLGARRLLGWSQKEMVLPEGTVEDWLKKIEVPGGGNLHALLVRDDGTPNPKYRFAVNQQVIDKEALTTTVREGDRLVVMDALHLPTLGCG